MKIESEKLLEKKLVKRVKEELKGWAIKLLATHITGIPDRMCLLPGGRIIFVEMKGTGLQPTKIQSRIHSRLRGLGFLVLVIDSSEKIEKFIRDHENHS